ncbi:hypothetical protein C2845_PM05G35270 [Panicum miliaceum]|uniref:Uncharacterized protein n=1 Tax=Panicum miliaceum TaxID=4540 RepID=A0A3L6SVP4_PANMI|nr:hypothetical protein C2845_PM05G35270 [Panicum miliaceum]
MLPVANDCNKVPEDCTQFVMAFVAYMLCTYVLENINNLHYLYRMTILQAISLLAPVMGAEITSQKLLPIVINSSKTGE